MADQPEEVDVQEEYRVWKRNSPYLYDLVITHRLASPSLTCQWLPGKEAAGDCVRQRLLLGTHSAEDNFVLIAEVQLPTPGEGEPSSAANNDAAYGAPTPKIHVVAAIPHAGEVNRARCMPQDRPVVATQTATGDIFVFDTSRTAAAATPQAGAPCKPDLILKGHSQQGYPLAWSPHAAGLLLSGSDDKSVCLWDVGGSSTSGPRAGAAGSTLPPKARYVQHSEVVMDVAWHPQHGHTFGSVGDDRRLILWDARQAPSSSGSQSGVSASVQAHDDAVNCLAFNPFNPHILATGSADKTVALFDLRNLTQPLHSLQRHEGSVLQIGWCPHRETVLASSGADDRRLNVWDLSRIGDEQSPEDAEDGPPELLFIHGGHTANVSDFSWSADAPWVVASVDEDEMLQVWQMAEDTVAGE